MWIDTLSGLLFLESVSRVSGDSALTEGESGTAGQNPIEEFLQYQYKEIKDMCAQFIALLSGILLFSVNFSDKLVNAKSAPIYYKHILVASWSCFIISIIGCAWRWR